MKKVVIIGAGPAGLAAAYELLKKGKNNFDITILEASDKIGGNARTHDFEGNRVDIGPHHFFTNSSYIKSLWDEILPEQGRPACDDKLLKREALVTKGGPDPDETDNVMLRRHRVSRILYEGKFFDYPLSFSKDTIKKLGLKKTFYFGMSLLKAKMFPRKEHTMADYLINNFGRGLYNEFFRSYTYKAWGDEPENISSECGTQRIQGISLTKAIKQLAKSILGIKPAPSDEIKGSINEVKEIKYPKYGAGQMWELFANYIEEKGVKIIKNTRVNKVSFEGKRVTEITAESVGDTSANTINADYFISTIPLSHLFKTFSYSNQNEYDKVASDAALNLKYRNFVMVGIFASRLNTENDTDMKTINNQLSDCWSYIYNNVAEMSRFNIYNNFSPYVVKNWESEVFLGMEYMCSESDGIWKLSDEDGIAFAIKEAEKLGLLDNKNVIRTIRVKETCAYPVYSGSYAQFDKIKGFIDGLDNLYSIGRKGQHRYLDMDQSMLTAVECVKHILKEIDVKNTIWEVTE